MVGEAQQQEARLGAERAKWREVIDPQSVPSDVLPATKLHPLKVPQPSQT